MSEETCKGLVRQKFNTFKGFPSEQDVTYNGITYFKENSYKDHTSGQDIAKLLNHASKKRRGGKGTPDFVVIKKNSDVVVVIECKDDINRHASDTFNTFKKKGFGTTKQIDQYAVNGALWYSNFLSDKYNVVAVAVSGIREVQSKVTSILFPKKGSIKDIQLIENGDLTNCLLPINLYENEVDKLLGRFTRTEEEIKKELRKYTLSCANFLRANGIEDKDKAGFISALILGLTNKESRLYNQVKSAIDSKNSTKSKVLDDLIGRNSTNLLKESLYGSSSEPSDPSYNRGIFDIDQIPKAKSRSLRKFYDILLGSDDLLNQPKQQYGYFKFGSTVLSACLFSLYENIITVYEHYRGIDVMGEFYTTFLRFTKGNAKEKGIVLTPKHITTLFCDLAEFFGGQPFTENTKIIDTCCGTGAFLISSLERIKQNIESGAESPEEKKAKIEIAQRNSLIGVEKNPSMYSLAYANMRFHGDGKSNLFNCSSLMSDSLACKGNGPGYTYIDDKNPVPLPTALSQYGNIDIGMINPPYSLNKKEKKKAICYPIYDALLEAKEKLKDLQKEEAQLKRENKKGALKKCQTAIRKQQKNIEKLNKDFEKANLKEVVIQQGQDELDFVASMLHYLKDGGIGIAIMPQSCAGNSGRSLRSEILKHHTLLACVTMPSQLFFDSHVMTQTCIMVFKAHIPHNEHMSVFFGRWTDDGYKVIPHNGRKETPEWETKRREWKNEINGTASPNDYLWMKRNISINDEALPEAYVKTDYSKLQKSDYVNSLKRYSLFRSIDKSGLLEFDNFDKTNWLLENYEQFAKEYSTAVSDTPVELGETSAWKPFLLGDENYFHIERGASGEGSYLKNMSDGDTPYISTTSDNNGISNYVSVSNREGNLISLAYDGSIGACFYQREPFFASEKIVTIDIAQTELNPFIAFFLIQVIKLESEMYSYGGRKWTVEQQLKSTALYLPVTEEGEPDYAFMEKFIKSLPYSKALLFKDEETE